jgi:L-galactose dehydrogenase
VYGGVEAREAIGAVRFAIDHGVNLVDTSPYYGDTLSERRIGEALQAGYRERVVLATKAGRYATGPKQGFDYSYERILRSWEESAERLRTGYFDVYQLHDVEFVRTRRSSTRRGPPWWRCRTRAKWDISVSPDIPWDISGASPRP